MGPAFSVNVVSVILQRDPNGDGGFQRVKVQRNKAGHTRHTVLQPLHLQGIESVDDGTRCLMYLPDNHLLVDQPSSQHDRADVEWRMRVASQNYKVSLAGNVKVAGRSAAVVVAKPKYRELDERRFYIDEVTGYPLRMETVDRAQGSAMLFDTVYVRYPEELENDLFALKPLGRCTRVKYGEPTKFVSPSAVREVMGFSPIIPTSLPLGFRVQEMQKSQDPEWHALVMRLSDGLVRATLYQWRAGSGSTNLKAFTSSSTREISGVRLLLVSEVGETEREKLLDSFSTRLQVEPETVVVTSQRSRATNLTSASELVTRNQTFKTSRSNSSLLKERTRRP